MRNRSPGMKTHSRTRNRSLVFSSCGSPARLYAADVNVVIPASNGTLTTNIVFTTAELGATSFPIWSTVVTNNMPWTTIPCL